MTSKTRMMLTALTIALLAAGCTTTPKQSGYLTTYDTMRAPEGVRGRRLATPEATAVPVGAPLVFDPIVFSSDADIDTSITPAQRALLLNQFGRALCTNLSNTFAIETTPINGAYRLRATITRVGATGRIATASALAIGVRPPIGLGAFIAEMEVIAPDGQQAAAMIWAQHADMLDSGRISRIGDAYDFTSAAASDFAALFPEGERTGLSRIAANVRGERDAACEAYGRENRVLSAGLGLLGVGVSPEVSDRAPTGTQPSTPP